VITEFDPDDAARQQGIYGLSCTVDEAQVVLLPVPFDATTSYRPGTVDGPQAILAASKQVDLFDVETGNPWNAGIAMLPESAEVRGWSAAVRPAAERVMTEGAGDRTAIALVDAAGERVNRFVQDSVDRLLDAGKLVGTVGGDHSVPFGAIAAHAERHPGFGILHIDAHADLRHAYEGFTWSHASIMDNVLNRVPAVERLVQVGVRDLCAEEHERVLDSAGRVVTWFDAELARERFDGATWSSQIQRIVADLPARVYVSFDVDGLDPQLCPNTGTPVPGGLSFQQANHLLAAVIRSGRQIVGFDLVEVAPGPAGDEWDANVGARLLYKLIGWMLYGRRGSGT